MYRYSFLTSCLTTLAIAISCVNAFSQQFIPDDWELIAHYPLYSTPNDTTGNYGPMELRNTTFADSALVLNGIYMGSIEPGGYIAKTPELDKINLDAVAVSVEFMTDSVQFSPVVNGGDLTRWATAWVSTDSLMFLSLNSYNTILLSELSWETDRWHETGFVIHNDTASLWLDGVWGVHVYAPTHRDDDRIITFDHSGIGEAFYGMVRNLKIYSGSIETAIESGSELPTEGIDLGVFPNPAGIDATVLLEARASGTVSLSLFDVLGRSVSSEVRSDYLAGRTEIPLNSVVEDLPAGLYLLTARSGRHVETVPLVVAR